MVQKKDSYNYKDILQMLPHRYPFLLIDNVLSIKRSGNESGVGDEIYARKNVTFNEPFFQGHFPEMPIMPGVLVIEAMAQAAGLCIYRPHAKGEKWKYFIAGVDKTRFRKPIVPGDVLDIKCKCLKTKSGFYSFQCQAFAGDELKAEAEILAQMSE